MMTSRLMSFTLPTRSSSLARPSGLSTALSKSKKASAAYVTLVAAGGCGAGAGAGAGRAAGAAGAAAGAGAGAWTTRAPSQPTAAVAGVQKLSRQQYSLVPFFQTSSLVPFTQLSMRLPPSAACTRVPVGADPIVEQPASTAADASNSATLFSFFMVLLLRGKSRSRAA